MSGTSPDSVTYPSIPYGVRTPWGTTTVNVLEWATGDGITDDTERIRAAILSLPPGGGTLYFPAATYLISSTLFLPSGTRVLGDGPATVLYAIRGAAWETNTQGSNDYTAGSFRALFANLNWTNNTISDEGYEFANFTADLDTNDSVARKSLLYFVSARNIEMHSVISQGGGSVTNFLHCQGHRVHHCIAKGLNTCFFDTWGGSSNFECTSNQIEHDPFSGYNPAIQFTGTRSDGTDDTSSTGVIAFNQVKVVGTLASVGVISASAGGAGGVVNNVLIIGNEVDLNGNAAGGIVCYGGGDNWRIVGNSVRNADDYPAIFLLENGYGTLTRAYVANNTIRDCTRTSAPGYVLAVDADGSTVVDNDVLGCTAIYGYRVDGTGCLFRAGNTYGSTFSSGASSLTAGVTVDGEISGTWTPSLNFGGATTGITYSQQTGIFRRTGSLVWVECYITLSSKGSATGNAQISGLPYTMSVGQTGAFTVVSAANFGGGITQTPVIRASTASFTIATALIGGTNLTDAAFSNGTVLYVQGWYRTG